MAAGDRRVDPSRAESPTVVWLDNRWRRSRKWWSSRSSKPSRMGRTTARGRIGSGGRRARAAALRWTRPSSSRESRRARTDAVASRHQMYRIAPEDLLNRTW